MSANQPFDLTTLIEVRERYSKGEPAINLARIYKKSKSWVHTQLDVVTRVKHKAVCLQTKQTKIIGTDDELVEINELYLDGHTIRAIAELTGHSRSWVHRRIIDEVRLNILAHKKGLI